MAQALQVWSVDGIGEVAAGDDLAAIVVQALAGPDGTTLEDGDVVVVTSKVVSKAEGRSVAAHDREDAITSETVREVATREYDGGVLRIVENKLGLVMAAAGVDASNTPEGTVLLLPEDPDASARALRSRIAQETGVTVGVLVADTAGRPWRRGVTDIAIGAAGVAVLDDLRGRPDASGRVLTGTVVGVADQLCAATELVRGKSAGAPLAVVRGAAQWVTADDGPGARSAVRPPEEDMFRQGSTEAYEAGYDTGYDVGYDDAVEETKNVQYRAGYDQGYADGEAQSESADMA